MPRSSDPPSIGDALNPLARLTLDITPTDDANIERLRGLLAATARTSAPDDTESRSDEDEDSGPWLRVGPYLENAIGRLPDWRADLEVDPALLERFAEAKLKRRDREKPPLHALRRDPHEDLVSGRLAGPLTALGGAERLGPFVIDDRPVFFDFWRAARRFEVTEQGASAPAFVLSSARRPRFTRGDSTTLDVQKGTVWIRGDLVDGGLPSGAYVGVTVSDGKLRLPNVNDSGEDTVEIDAPLEAELELILHVEPVDVEEGGCDAGVSLDVPKLVLKFSGGGLTIEGDEGAARVWGQEFSYAGPSGSVLFVPQLWTLLIGYEVEPETFDAGAIASKLAESQGEAEVKRAALALPVVVAQPAALGPAAVSPGFWMALAGMQARWYVPDQRFHLLDPWMALSNRGMALLDIDVAPLSAPVETTFRLWELPDRDGRRAPWRHDYVNPFLFFHRCDAQTGEALLASGRARVNLDRPVMANGRTVPTPTETGMLLLRTSDTGVRAMLGAAVNDAPDSRLVLRNALVWATGAAWVVAQGVLRKRRDIERGSLLVSFGVYSWTPTLPDPYVGNFEICRPSQDRPRALLGALVTWVAPDNVRVTFGGDIGLPMLCPHKRSSGDPVPAPGSDLNPDVGQTQTEQGRLYPGKAQAGAIARAQSQELENRSRRVAKAQKLNQASLSALDGQMAERLGPTPPVFLLDVSTNQDLLGVAMWGSAGRAPTHTTAVVPSMSAGGGGYSVRDLEVHSPVEAMRLMTLPQVQWEPVRTLDEDQDVMTLGWFPTPLASATDGGPTVLGARSQKLAPVIPEPLLGETKALFDEGTGVTFRTTLPFGIVTLVDVNPQSTAARDADSYEIKRPDFPDEGALGGLQITARAESGREANGDISPYFAGHTRQLINGVDLASGAPLGLSVLSSTGDPGGDVETIFNNDMTSNPKVPVTRFDLSGYGGSNFSKWENPFALFAETAKTQFQMTVGRTALEIIKVASVLHPWGIKVTRSVIVERRSGGGVIRRDTGWQATSHGLLDYRYIDKDDPAPDPQVADYAFDAGIFKGLFNIRSIRPAPGVEFSSGGATFVPYYFDAELALDGMPGRTQAIGVLGWLQTAPNGDPASAQSMRDLIEAQGAVGGPVDTWLDFGASTLPFRARRIEMDVVDDGGSPLFVATVRGVPKLPTTGAWSVVRRPVTSVPPGGGEAVPVSETRGVPIIRRYPVKYPAGDDRGFAAPPLAPGNSAGDWRMADPADLLSPASPKHDYCILQSAPTHGFLFPRPHSRNGGAARLRSTVAPELADILARSTSKGAFPPRENVITMAGPMHFNVGDGGAMTLSNVINVVNHPTPLRLAGETGHGTELDYADATMELELTAEQWRAEFTGLSLWSDIAGLERASGARMRIVGSTVQRPQVSSIETLVYEPVEKILSYLPVFGAREALGPIDLGAANAKHEIKVEISTIHEFPEEAFPLGGCEIKLLLGAGGSTGWDLESGGLKASGELMAGAKGECPILSVGVAQVYIIVQLDVKFNIASVVGVVTEEKLELVAFAGIGVKGQVGPFKAYAYLGIGFVFIYDFTTDTPKFGGLVRFEAGIDLKVVKVKLLAELKGVIYKKTEALPPPDSGTTEKTLCDYTGKVKLQVDIFLIISISATYTVTGTKSLE